MEESSPFFPPFSHAPSPKQYHRGYTRGSSNSGCNRDPQRLKLRGRNLPLQFRELCGPKKEEPTSTAFFFFIYPPVIWSQTWADSHEVYDRVAFGQRTKKGRSKELWGTRELAEEQLRKMAPGNCLWIRVKAQAAKAWIKTTHNISQTLWNELWERPMPKSRRLATRQYIQGKGTAKTSVLSSHFI